MATMKKVAGHAASGVTGAVFAAGLMLATPMVAKHEGMWLTAKPDMLAHGIPTVCFGETEGVKIGDRYTPKECEEQLKKKLVRYANSAAACIYVPVSAKIFATTIDLNYNIGEGAFCSSTVAARLNERDYGAACDAMRAWTHAGGQFRQGLLNRRIDEIKLCHEGIKDLIDGKGFDAPVTKVADVEPEAAPKAETKPAEAAAPAKLPPIATHHKRPAAPTPGFWCVAFKVGCKP